MQTTYSRTLENSAWQDLSISHHYDHVRLKRANLFNGFSIFNAVGLQDWHLHLAPRFFDLRRFDPLLAADRFVRLRDHADEFVLFGVNQSSQRRHADFTRADEDNAHCLPVRLGPPKEVAVSAECVADVVDALPAPLIFRRR